MKDSSFRSEVQAFLRESLTPEIKRAGELMTSVFSDFDAGLAWHKILYKKGWVAPDWPLEYGGTGWSLSQRYIFQEECKLANAPAASSVSVCTMLAPGAYCLRAVTEAQKQQFLPRILSERGLPGVRATLSQAPDPILHR